MKEPNTLDEQIDSLFTDLEVSVGDLYGEFHEEEIREKFHAAKQQLKTLFTEHSKQQLDKSIELMKDILMENFHYRIMCGEIKDPTGKIDVHKAFVEYQELEPERIKFAQYVEELSKRNK